MLDKELDKLRDKTLSFGCIIQIIDNEGNFEYGTVLRNNHGFEILALLGKKTNWYNTEYIKKTEIIGHPLTYGRIYSLSYKLRNTKSGKVADEILYNKTDIERILKEKDLIDKTELERQQSPHREELKALLIQFSNYL